MTAPVFSEGGTGAVAVCVLRHGYNFPVIERYDELTPDALAPLGFDDPAHACRLLQDMAGHNVPDSVFNAALCVLMIALTDCADPDRAVANLARWAEAAGSRVAAYGLLAAHPPAAQILITVLAASQFFANLLIQTPEYLEALTNTRVRQAHRSPETMYADMARRVMLPTLPNARRDALRRVKGPEVLRIGVRDLLGEASFEETVADISAFADASVRLAWEICLDERRGPERFAILAMGKLGGRELNYSSDIDLIFVHGDDEDGAAANKMGEAVRDTLDKATGAGFVFRVDLRLRPEGRFGPLSRSLSSCRAYYESWAEPWERQALMKARCVAGDAALGEEFLAMARAFVYPPRVDEAFVDSIRRNKRRLEQKVARAGEADVNVKEGVGGIRDVEFTTQLMQLVAGGANPTLQTGSTLEALALLTNAGLLTPQERDTLRESYIFMRTVEHRLQLLDEQAVRTLPREAGTQRKFARRLGYPHTSAFLRDFHFHARRANALFTRLFYGEDTNIPAETNGADNIADWTLATDDPAAQASLRDVLDAHGIADTDNALRLIRRAVQGSEYGGVRPEARDAFAALLSPLLAAAAATANPDAALRGFDALADAVPSRSAWLATLQGSLHFLPRLATLAGDAPFLWQTLLNHLEFLDMLADEEVMGEPRTFLPAASVPQTAMDALRARLHIGARDAWGLAATAETLLQTTRAAEAALQSSLSLAIAELSYAGQFAIIGLGKLGGAEMAYSSDMDVLYVASEAYLTLASRVAERLQHILRDDLKTEGVHFEIDARLRPDGRKGALVLDINTYRSYYAHCSVWERQMLIKARPVAGDAELGQEFALMAEQVAYAAPADAATLDAVRAMKRRIETERVKSPHDLKLAAGGLSDIEWAAQILQLMHGAKRPRLRKAGTLPALVALRDDALITQADWETLSNAYLHFAQWRNRLFLQSGVSGDSPAALPEELRARMQAVRMVFIRVFQGDTNIHT